mmetsp:Transcript_17989/g.23584  ORF Transcript_17989/g.23584 Transcript_17989/m.23584 type:complete len:94 (-) Transcript_17989:374-655(-)
MYPQPFVDHECILPRYVDGFRLQKKEKKSASMQSFPKIKKNTCYLKRPRTAIHDPRKRMRSSSGNGVLILHYMTLPLKIRNNKSASMQSFPEF